MGFGSDSSNRYIVTSAKTKSIHDSTILLQLLPNPPKRIIEIVHDPFLQRDDPVVGNLNVLRANLRATFRDVAVADPVRLPQFLEAILGVERMHLERGCVDQIAR